MGLIKDTFNLCIAFQVATLLIHALLGGLTHSPYLLLSAVFSGIIACVLIIKTIQIERGMKNG